MGPKASNCLLDDNLKACPRDQRECKPENAICSVAEAPQPDLGEENDNDGYDDAD